MHPARARCMLSTFQLPSTKYADCRATSTCRWHSVPKLHAGSRPNRLNGADRHGARPIRVGRRRTNTESTAIDSNFHSLTEHKWLSGRRLRKPKGSGHRRESNIDVHFVWH